MDDSRLCQAPLGAALTFNEETHEYVLNGAPVPSVTGILSDVMNGGKKQNYPAGSGERGRMVHLACELDDMDDLDDDTLDPALSGYVAAWRAFRSDYAPRWLGIEAHVYSARHGYAGTFDRLAMIADKVTLIDLKSGREMKSHALQTAGYAIAYEENTLVTVRARACVYVDKAGNYSVTWYDDETDREVFLAARTLYRWRNRW